MLQIQSLSLGNLCIPVATNHILNVLQTSTLPPLSWDNSVVVILLISQPLVDTWIPESHYYYYVFILSAISPYTTGLKALFNQSDCTGTAPTHK